MIQKSVLVAIINRKKDFDITRDFHWYRIPVVSAPKIVREKRIKYIAFYHTRVFNEIAYSIQWYAPVETMKIVKRLELLPDEKDHSRKYFEYFKIEIGELIPLSCPIVSRRRRNVVFIETTPNRLLAAEEINDLFHGSRLEEKFWESCKEQEIDAEREFVVKKDDYTFFLDFALMCKKGKLDVECDSGRYHLSQIYQSKRDTKRDNILKSLGWDVYRFSENDVYKNLPQTIGIVKEAINRYGGVEIVGEKDSFKTFPHEATLQQIHLFKHNN